VLKEVPEGLTIVTKPLVGAYAGMLVEIFKQESAKTAE
jgi:hypothetical protein